MVGASDHPSSARDSFDWTGKDEKRDKRLVGVCATRSGFTVARRHSVKAGLAFGFRNKLPIQQDKEKKKSKINTSDCSVQQSNEHETISRQLASNFPSSPGATFFK